MDEVTVIQELISVYTTSLLSWSWNMRDAPVGFIDRRAGLQSTPDFVWGFLSQPSSVLFVLLLSDDNRMVLVEESPFFFSFCLIWNDFLTESICLTSLCNPWCVACLDLTANLFFFLLVFSWASPSWYFLFSFLLLFLRIPCYRGHWQVSVIVAQFT